jgi:hypothetical protein
MPSRDEIAAQVAKKLRINYKDLSFAEFKRGQILRIWDALIDAEVKLAEREQETQQMQANCERHNTPHAEPHSRTLACHAPPKCKPVAASEERVKELREALERGHLYFLQSNNLSADDREMLEEMWGAIKRARAVLSEE